MLIRSLRMLLVLQTLALAWEAMSQTQAHLLRENTQREASDALSKCKLRDTKCTVCSRDGGRGGCTCLLLAHISPLRNLPTWRPSPVPHAKPSRAEKVEPTEAPGEQVFVQDERGLILAQ